MTTSPLATAGRLAVGVLRGLFALTVLGGVLIGLPWALITGIGWPLPDHIPTLDEASSVLTSPLDDGRILNLLAILAWLVWAWFLRDVTLEALQSAADLTEARRGRPRPIREATGPVRTVAAVLVGAVVGTLLLHLLRGAPAIISADGGTLHGPGHSSIAAGALTDPAPPDKPNSTTAGTPPSVGGAAMATSPVADQPGPSSAIHPPTAPPITAVPRPTGSTTPAWAVDAPGGTHTVADGDTLLNIAERRLGDQWRWREIYVLNRGKPQSNGYALTDPDEIHVGWVLALPTAAPNRTAPATPTNATLTRPDAVPPVLPIGTGVLVTDDGCAYLYSVQTGESLWQIAQRCTGDGRRWPEIWRLNHGRTWPAISGYTRFNNPDLIYPNWQLRLPATWAPPPEATEVDPTPPTTDPPLRPTPPTSPTPSPSISPSADPDGVIAAPTAAPTATDPNSTRSLSSPPTPAGTPADLTSSPAGSNTGVNLPGGWVPLSLAAAFTAAAAMVWKRRRHRYQPSPYIQPVEDDADLQTLPAALTAMRRNLREHAPSPTPLTATLTATSSDDNAEVDPPPLPPVGPSGPDLAGLTDLIGPTGVGLAGPGAEPAARALMLATLSTGSPTDPDARGTIVVPADALTTLLGVDAVEVGAIPRLIVTATLSQALTHLETALIERRRLLDEYDAPDLPSMRNADPYHPPMPPLLLIADTPPAEAHTRLATTLQLGAPLQISAALLGDWPHGDTTTVREDGHLQPDGRRLAVLDVPTTLDLLHVLREAHTGQPPPPATPATDTAPPAVPDPTDPEPTDDTSDALDHPSPPDRGMPEPSATGKDDDGAVPAAEPATSTGSIPVRITLMGRPAILDPGGNPVPGLRHHATELLVYLAVRRDGADLRAIMETFWPDAAIRRASERLSTEVGNLRRRIREAADDPEIKPVTNSGGRYHLNPDLVDVDTWRLTAALQRAAAATDPAAKQNALRDAITAHTGTLAEGCDYDWIEPVREQYRRHGICARLHLADLLTPTDPLQAAELTSAAARTDPYNEDLAQRAMRAQARVNDPIGVRTHLQQLRAALDEIDEEPTEETTALATQLLRETLATDRSLSSEAGGHPLR